MLGQEFILEYIYPKLETLVTSIEKIINKNTEIVKDYINLKYGKNKLPNNSNSKNKINNTHETDNNCNSNCISTNNSNFKLNTMLKSEISFSKTFNINNLNYDDLEFLEEMKDDKFNINEDNVKFEENNKKNSSVPNINNKENIENNDNKKSFTISKNNPNNLKEIYFEISNNFNTSNDTVIISSFVYYSLKVSSIYF